VFWGQGVLRIERCCRKWRRGRMQMCACVCVKVGDVGETRAGCVGCVFLGDGGGASPSDKELTKSTKTMGT
jgi:hypothetical protein